jgi:hypothetical protein
VYGPRRPAVIAPLSRPAGTTAHTLGTAAR